MSQWLETHCGWCHTTIAYLPEWSHIPEYCRDCNEWLEKDCLNPHCPGRIKYKVYWSNIHDYCDCRGWYEIKCVSCYQYFRINDQWDNKPEYCPSCREWKERNCANRHCNGKVRYKEFWDNKPDYCTCKGWYEARCGNSNCRNSISVHSSWSNIPEYCKDCNSWHEKACATSGCTEKVSYKPLWSNPPDYCDTCRKLGGSRRDPWKDPRNAVEQIGPNASGVWGQKIMSGPDKGLHRGYDPDKIREFEAGKDYERRKR